MIRAVWSRLSESEQNDLVSMAGKMLRSHGARAMFLEYLARKINVRPKTLLKADQRTLVRYLRFGLWKLSPRQRGELLCQSYLHEYPGKVAALYAALDVPVDVEDPSRLRDDADEQVLSEERFSAAIQSLATDADDMHALMMCASIADGGLRSWQSGAQAAVRRALPTFRPVAEPGPEQVLERAVEQVSSERGQPEVDRSDADAADDCKSSEPMDRMVFTAMDRLLIRTVIDSLHGQEGALSIDEAEDVIQEVLDLNSSRTVSRFHEGFMDALRIRPLAGRTGTANDERDGWYLVGFFLGRLRLAEPTDVLAEVKSLPKLRRALLVGENAGAPSLELLPHLLRAAFSSDDVDFVLEAVRKAPKPEMSLLGETLDWIEGHLLHRDTASAMTVLGHVEDWLSVDGYEPGERLVAEVYCGRLRLTLHRMRGEFTAVARLRTALTEEAQLFPPQLWAKVPGEQALAALGIRDIASIAIPDAADAALFVKSIDEHMAPGLIDRVWRHWPPTAVLSALPALLDSARDQETAIRLLETSVSEMSGSRNAIWRDSGLLDRARVYLSVLELENGRSSELGRPVARVLDLLRDKVDVSSDLLVRVLEAAVAGDAPRVRELAYFLLNVAPRDVLLMVDNEDMASRSAEYRQGLRTRLELHNLGLVPTEKVRILLQAARGARDSNEADLDFARWAIDEANSIATRDTSAAGLLSESLADRGSWEGILDEQEADEFQMQLLDRTGRLGTYQGILLRRINTAVADRQLAIACDLLDIWDEKGFDDQALLSRRRQIEAMEGEARQSRRDPNKEESKWYQDLVLLFVGGNELQAQYRDDLIEQFKRKFPGLRIEFHFPGWSANWGGKADQVKRELQDADAMVLMPMIRTMFGRTVRKAAGEARVPWIPCTGTGRASLERALLEGVRVAVEQRKKAAREAAASQSE